MTSQVGLCADVKCDRSTICSGWMKDRLGNAIVADSKAHHSVSMSTLGIDVANAAANFQYLKFALKAYD